MQPDSKLFSPPTDEEIGQRQKSPEGLKRAQERTKRFAGWHPYLESIGVAIEEDMKQVMTAALENALNEYIQPGERPEQ